MGGFISPGASSIITFSDSSYFVQGAMKDDRDRLHQGGNGDLWEEYDKERNGKSLPKKIKAHAEEKVLCGEANVDEYILNMLADAAADAHAAAMMIDGLVARAVEDG